MQCSRHDTQYSLECRECREQARLASIWSEKTSHLPLPRARDFDGFYVTDVNEYLERMYGEKPRLAFNQYLMGKTLGFEDERPVIYSWDLARFLHILEQ